MVRWRLSLRGDGDKYVDDPPMWRRATEVLRAALAAVGVPFEEAPGEAAFYGPKIDIQLRDHAGRESTLATVQVDFYMPQRFDLSYVDAEGKARRPVMVHRSAAGSMERLFAHLIEAHAGAFPVWYSPVQIGVVPASNAAHTSSWSCGCSRLVPRKRSSALANRQETATSVKSKMRCPLICRNKGGPSQTSR